MTNTFAVPTSEDGLRGHVGPFGAPVAPLLDIAWVGSDERERGLNLLEESNPFDR